MYDNNGKDMDSCKPLIDAAKACELSGSALRCALLCVDVCCSHAPNPTLFCSFAAAAAATTSCCCDCHMLQALPPLLLLALLIFGAH